MTRFTLFLAGLVLTCMHCAGPARASTTEDALDSLCGPGHRDLAPHVDAAARRYLLHPVTLVSVISVESRCVSSAVGRRYEIGLMQISPYGPAKNGLPAAELFDPATNVHTGARWLALMTTWCGGNLPCGLGAYNTGKRGHGKRYARKVMTRIAEFWRAMTNNEPRS